MRNFLIFLNLTILPSILSAATINKVNNLQMRSVSQNQVEITYQVDGGCQEHSTKISFKSLNKLRNFNRLKLKLIDISDAKDDCEGLIRKTVTIHFGFGKLIGMGNSLILRDRHGGCPKYSVTRDGDMFTVQKYQDACFGNIPVNAPLKVEAMTFE